MIHARIQAHPSRAHLHGRLLKALEPIQTELFTHESVPPDPWANYKRCLDYRGSASHLLIAQDDVIPAPNFVAATEKIATANPNTPVCLFMGAFPASTATRVRRAKPDERYVALGPSSFMPLVCVLWPSHVARSFLDWSNTAQRMTRADDGNAARWMRATKQQVLVAVPSIVQHDDGQPSVKGGRDHVPWAEAWRRALFLTDDATSYDWLASVR